MAVKLQDGRYKCQWCNKIYDHPLDADSCRDSHDIVYVPMLRSDVGRLLQFIMTHDEELITETLYNSLTKFKGKIV
jgi:hypothetical protein